MSFSTWSSVRSSQIEECYLKIWQEALYFYNRMDFILWDVGPNTLLLHLTHVSFSLDTRTLYIFKPLRSLLPLGLKTLRRSFVMSSLERWTLLFKTHEHFMKPWLDTTAKIILSFKHAPKTSAFFCLFITRTSRLLCPELIRTFLCARMWRVGPFCTLRWMIILLTCHWTR